MKIKFMTLCGVASLLCIGCTTQTAQSSHVSQMQEDIAVVKAAEGACRVNDACDVVSDISDEGQYGGIKKEYTVKGCKVTIYNDGPIKMVNEKTDQPCNASIPKDHDFGGTKRVYKENGCTITEYKQKNGVVDATQDCPY